MSLKNRLSAVEVPTPFHIEIAIQFDNQRQDLQEGDRIFETDQGGFREGLRCEKCRYKENVNHRVG